MDHYPFCLLGGYAEGTSASPEGAIALASIASYMSIASMIRAGDDKEVNIVKDLNEVLASSSFLVGMTFKPTLADYDVFYALSEKNALGADVVTKDMKHLRRWSLAVRASIEELSSGAAEGVKGVPEVTVPDLDYGIADAVPMFYYGEEDVTSVSASVAAVAAGDDKSKPATPAGNANKGGKAGLSEEEKKAAVEKRAKKAAEKAKKKDAQPKAVKAKHGGGGGDAPVSELDVTALDIRVGKIIEAWEHESSDKLWCEKIDIGEKEPRQVLSGLRAFYKKEEMENRTVMVLCNLKKRNLAGVPSHGMVLCASNADHTAVEFVIPPEGAKIGERVQFGDLTGEPETESRLAKKKMLEKLAPDLKTDGEGVVVWKEHKSVTSAGPCVASKGMKDAQVS